MNYFALSWKVTDIRDAIRITSTGVNEKNDRFVVTIDGFTPHVFIAPKQYTPIPDEEIIRHYNGIIMELLDIKKYHLSRRNFHIITPGYQISNGFSYNRAFPVLRINVSTLRVYRQLIYDLHPTKKSNSLLNLNHQINDNGIRGVVVYDVYNEYRNKEEMLFIQERDLNAAGWNQIDSRNASAKTTRGKLYDTYHIYIKNPTMISGIPLDTSMPEPSVLLCAIDIEQYSCRERSAFPTASEPKDAIFMISISFKRSNEAVPFKNFIVHLKTYDEPKFQMDNASVIECESERDLIEAYATVIRVYNPNITYGYNILTYDIPRIMDRYKQYYSNITTYIIDQLLPAMFESWPDPQPPIDETFLVHTSPKTRAAILNFLRDLYDAAPNNMSATTGSAKHLPKQELRVSKAVAAVIKKSGHSIKEFTTQVCATIIDYIPDRIAASPQCSENLLLEQLSQDNMPAEIQTPLIKVEAKIVKGVMTIETPANLMVDVYYIVRAEALFFEEKLSSLSLNNVSEKILGDAKEDMPYDTLFQYYEKPTAERYKEMATYCLKDSTLCHDLFESFNTLAKSASLATLCYINLRDIFYSGQTRKVESVVKKKALEMSNTLIKYQTTTDNIAKYKHRVRYDGAFVFEPEPGIYSHISCLDFASLYPSLIISKNISPDAILGYKIYYIEGSKELVRQATKGKPIEFSATKHGYCTSDNKFRYRRLTFMSFREQLVNAKRTEQERQIYVSKKDLAARGKALNVNYRINTETIHLSRYAMVYDAVEGRDVVANKNKSNFKGFYEMKAYFISDVDAPENTGILSTVSQYLLTERRIVKKRLLAPHAEMERTKAKLFSYIDNALEPSEADAIKYAVNSGSMIKIYKIAYMYSDELTVSKILREHIAAKKQYTNVDAQQLAIKLVGNSTYGLTGATTSPFYEVALAGSITAAGRNATLSIADLVPQWYKGSRIVYGDTDSIMIEFVKLPTAATTYEDRKQIAEMSVECSERINDYFERKLGKQTLIIEFEKVISPFIITKKKRYIGMYYESSMETPDKKIKNGTILKKRNYGPFAKNLYELVTDILIEGGDAGDAFRRIEAILLDQLIKFQTMSKELPIDLYIRSMRLADMNEISTATKVPAVFYFNEMVPKSRQSKFDLGGRVQYFSVHRPLYFNRKVKLLNDSKSYFIKDADAVYAEVKTDDKIRKVINPFIHTQSEIRGPIFNQLLTMLGFDASAIAKRMIEFQYDGADRSVANTFFVRKVKDSVMTWLGSNKLAPTEMYIKVITYNTFNEKSPIGISEIRGVKTLPRFVKAYFERPKPPVDWQMYTWSDADKMYIDKPLVDRSLTVPPPKNR